MAGGVPSDVWLGLAEHPCCTTITPAKRRGFEKISVPLRRTGLRHVYTRLLRSSSAHPYGESTPHSGFDFWNRPLILAKKLFFGSGCAAAVLGGGSRALGLASSAGRARGTWVSGLPAKAAVSA